MHLNGQRIVAIWGITNGLMVVMIYGVGESGIDSGLYVSADVIVWLFAAGLLLADRSAPESRPLRRQPTSGAPALVVACGLFAVTMGTFFGDWLSLLAPVLVGVGLVFSWMWSRSKGAEVPASYPAVPAAPPAPRVPQPADPLAGADLSAPGVPGGISSSPPSSVTAGRPDGAPRPRGPAPIPVTAGSPQRVPDARSNQAPSQPQQNGRSGSENR